MANAKSIRKKEMTMSIDKGSINGGFLRFDPFATILSLVVIFFSSQIIASLIVRMFSSALNRIDGMAGDWVSVPTATQVAFIIITELIVIYMVLKLVSAARRKVSDIGLVAPVGIDFIRAILGWVVYFFISFIALFIASSVVSFDQTQNIGFEQASSQFDLLMTFLALVVFVPLAEEIVFRGFLFSSLRAKFNFHISAIITSVLFGLAHLWNGPESSLLWVVAIDTLVLSYIMCILRERTGSLWSAIFIHMIKNGMAFVVLFGSRIGMLSLLYA